MVLPPQGEQAPEGLWQVGEAMAGIQELMEPSVQPAEKRPRRQRPSREKLQSLIQRATEFWSLRDQRMDEDLVLYRMMPRSLSLRKGGDEEEAEGEVVIRNIPWVLVEKAASILSKQMPSIDTVPPENRLRGEAQAIEDFLRYAWEVWDRRWMQGLHGPLLRDIAHFLCLRGWVTIRISYNADAPPGELPVDLFVCDPRQVYPQLGANGLRYVVHRYWATVGEVLDEWPEAEKLLAGRDEDEIVEVVAYYDDWWHYLEVDGVEVKPPTAHGYGFVPWVVATGLGAPVRATTLDQLHWTREVGVSVFHGIRRAYQQLNRLVSQLATEVARVANPPTVYYYDPARPDNPQPIKLSAGATNFLYFDRERVEVLQVTPNPANAAPVMQALLDDIEKGGLPGVLWGVGQGSGFALTLQADAAMDTLHPLTRVLEQVIEQVNQRALELIRDLHDGPVGYLVRDPLTGRLVSGQEITPDLIAAVGTRTIVRFRKVTPRDRVQMAQLAALLTDKKLISLETARDEFLGLDNPQRENERVLADLAYLDPEVTREVLVPWALARTDPVLYELWRQAKLRKEQKEQPRGRELPGTPPVPEAAPPTPPPEVLPPQLATLMNLLQHSQASIRGGQGEEAPPGVPGAEPLPGAGEIPGLI
jgi:hypothetical protein